MVSNNNQFNTSNENDTKEVFLTQKRLKQLLHDNKRSAINTCIVIVIIATIINIIIFAAFRANAIDKISNDLSTEVTQKVEDNVNESLTDKVLEQYARQYKIPDEYTTIGTYVNSKARESVVEIYCQNSGQSSTATGMIVNEQGYILTNAHVVTYKQTYGGIFDYETRTEVYPDIVVRLKGKDVYKCDVVEFDESKDLAIIKMKNFGDIKLKPIVFGDSDRINLGEGAVVIGNAFGLGVSVTTGTITNVNPVNLDDNRDIIQTDTAINSGNSGGPLFDIGANCIGVATFKIVSKSIGENTEGLGFAISSNYAKDYLRSKGVTYITDIH